MKEKGKSIKVYLLGMLIVGIGMGLTTVIADTIINSTNVSYKTSTVKAALDDLYGLTADDIWQKIYPIGSIYTSVSPTSPATLFGGTWERFGNGKAIVGVDESDDDFKTVALTGGSKTKTIAVENLPAHTHGVNINTNSTNHNHGTINTTSTNHSHGTINTTNTGAHVHTIEAPSGHKWGVDYSQWNYGNGSVITPFKFAPSKVNAAGAGYGNDYAKAVSAGAHTHQVTINNSGAHTHQVTINNSGAHTHNVNGNTGSTGSGTALNVQNPYITVYMWKRTA